MTQSKEHTPLPWEVGTYTASQAFQQMDHHTAIMRPDGSLLAVTGPADHPASEQDAAFIVEACNNYERLLRENKRLREALTESDRVIRKYGDNGWKFGQRALELNKSLLAKSGDRHE